MITLLKHHAHTIAVSLLAAAIMTTLVIQHFRIPITTYDPFDPLFEDSGKWAIRFLVLCLLMTPLNTLFGWRAALKLRKPAGLWAFGFALLHYLTYTEFQPLKLEWLNSTTPVYYFLGFGALLILIALAATSTRWAMKRLGQWWKRLHRLVYGGSVLAAAHAIIALSSSKKIIMEGETLRHELYVYLAVLVVLLSVRLPFVKRLVQRLKRRRVPIITPITSQPIPGDRALPITEPEFQSESESEAELVPV